MKVMFLVDTLGSGGAERSLQELLPVLVDCGVQPLVVCFHHRDEGVERLVGQRHDLRFLRSRGRLGQMLELRRLLRSEQVELIHTTLFEADVFGRAAALGSGVPIVTSLVNMPYEPSRLAHDRNVNRTKLLAARLLEVATGRPSRVRFHAISQAVKHSAMERLLLPDHAITVAYRGRDAARLGRRSGERRRSARHALGIHEAQRVILTAGRQEFQKGQRFLLDALGHGADRDTLLLLAGRRGNASAELERAAVPLADRVVFLGHRDDLPELMCAADVFVLPSLWEGLGGVLIEAMALELPIIASDLPPVREVTQPRHAAHLVPPASAAALSDALTAFWQSPERERERAARARALFEERYSIERSGKLLFEIFLSAQGANACR